jgi:hypothetical protein
VAVAPVPAVGATVIPELAPEPAAAPASPGGLGDHLSPLAQSSASLHLSAKADEFSPGAMKRATVPKAPPVAPA